MTRAYLRIAAAFVLAIPAFAEFAGAQQAPAAVPLNVGSTAPDFSLPGATRYGVLSKPVTLSDYRGQTVVLAFFSRARTRG